VPVRQLTSNLTTRGWLIAGASAIGAILFVYLFVHMVSKPGYSTLATGLEPAQTGKMTGTLDQHGIGYELQNNGTALAVQSNETAQARVALSGAGLLGNTQPGFQQLYEKSSLSESTFQQQVTYQRALQGQLEQTIATVQGVSGAQVELVLPNPQSQLFGESQAPSSAAVLLTGSGALEPSAVRGIAQLVSSSVPGLHLDKVTITDGSGRLLWPSQSSEGAGATGKQAAQERYDQALEANLNTMLAQTLGAGKAQVQVNAELNTNQTTQEALTYGKAGVPLQQSKDLETLTGSGGGTGGAAGTANIPAYAQTGASGKSNYKHETTNSTLGVNKTVTHSTIAPGAVTSQHVSVLLDQSVPAAAVPAIKEAVTNAAGIQSTRGDTLSIAQMAFAKQPTPAAAAGAAGGIIGYAKYALIGIASLVFLFFTTRALRRREQEGIDHEPAWLRELELPVRLSELERETPPRPTEAMASMPAQGAGNPVRRQAEQLAESSPERVAQQLRSWMQED
jgi:flagellar M-ring protein FliF